MEIEMKASTENDELLPDSVAAAILGVTKGTLASWRSQGRGAAYVKIGRRVRYFRTDLTAFVVSRRRDVGEAP
jgi:hypothetical protein